MGQHRPGWTGEYRSRDGCGPRGDPHGRTLPAPRRVALLVSVTESYEFCHRRNGPFVSRRWKAVIGSMPAKPAARDFWRIAETLFPTLFQEGLGDGDGGAGAVVVIGCQWVASRPSSAHHAPRSSGSLSCVSTRGAAMRYPSRR